MERIVLKHLSGSKANQIEEFPLNHVKELVLGRDPSATVKYDPDRDDLVGRQHARINQDQNDPAQFIITDLNSRNGTFVNRQRIVGTSRVNPGDVVQLGPGGPEFVFDVEPRPQSATKPTRGADIGLPPTVQATTAPVPQTRNVGTGSSAYQGAPSFQTAPAGGGVGKHTVMRMINENVTEAKRKQSRSYLLVGAAVVLLLIVLFGGVAGFLVWRNRASQVELSEVKQNIASKESSAALAPDAIANANRAAVVKIKVAWHLTAPDGRQLYQLYASSVPKDFKGGSIRPSRDGIPCWVLLEGTPQNPTKVEPFLYDGRSIQIPGGIRAFDNPIPISGYGYGTGFVVSSDGFILTARHVAAGWRTSYDFPNSNNNYGLLFDRTKSNLISILRPDQVPSNWVPANTQQEMGGLFDGKNDILEVSFPGSENRIKAELVQVSPRHDAALIKVHLPDATPKVELKDNYDTIKQGDAAIVLGYPAASPMVTHVTISQDFFNRETQQNEIPDPTLSVGNIGRVLRGNENPFDKSNAYSTIGDAYQLTINSTGEGNSGGPVFDDHGNVVGIFFAGSRSGNVVLTYAVPIRYGKELMSSGGK